MTEENIFLQPPRPLRLSVAVVVLGATILYHTLIVPVIQAVGDRLLKAVARKGEEHT